MYIVNTALKIRWLLAPTGSPLTSSDYDIRLVPPSLSGTYTDDGIINFTAPSATHSGVLEYDFTPLFPGLWKVFLTTGTGASYQVLEEETFWLFETAPTSAAALRVLGVLSRPTQSEFYSGFTSFATQYMQVNGLSQHPVDTNKIYVAMRKSGADAKGGYAILNTDDGSITEQLLTSPLGYTVGIAVNETGRVCTISMGVDGGQYRAYYSDDNMATWTMCTQSGFTTASAGNYNIYYDRVLKIFIWQIGTKLAISLDGITFYHQQVDFYDTDVSPYDHSALWLHRVLFEDDTSLILSGYRVSGGTTEALMKMQVTTPPSSAPMAWQDWNIFWDIYGAGYGQQNIHAAAVSIDGNNIWAVSSAGVFIRTTGKNA
ncbi:MAG: hypothetical protein V3S69_07775, partial [Dehalococcoidales bacterium]